MTSERFYENDGPEATIHPILQVSMGGSLKCQVVRFARPPPPLHPHPPSDTPVSRGCYVHTLRWPPSLSVFPSNLLFATTNQLQCHLVPRVFLNPLSRKTKHTRVSTYCVMGTVQAPRMDKMGRSEGWRWMGPRKQEQRRHGWGSCREESLST